MNDRRDNLRNELRLSTMQTGRPRRPRGNGRPLPLLIGLLVVLAAAGVVWWIASPVVAGTVGGGDHPPKKAASRAHLAPPGSPGSSPAAAKVPAPASALASAPASAQAKAQPTTPQKPARPPSLSPGKKPAGQGSADARAGSKSPAPGSGPAHGAPAPAKVQAPAKSAVPASPQAKAPAHAPAKAPADSDAPDPLGLRKKAGGPPVAQAKAPAQTQASRPSGMAGDDYSSARLVAARFVGYAYGYTGTDAGVYLRNLQSVVVNPAFWASPGGKPLHDLVRRMANGTKLHGAASLNSFEFLQSPPPREGRYPARIIFALGSGYISHTLQLKKPITNYTEDVELVRDESGQWRLTSAQVPKQTTSGGSS